MGKGLHTTFPSPPPPLHTHFLPPKSPLKGHNNSKFRLHKDLCKKRLTACKQANLSCQVPGGVLLGILGGGVPPDSSNPDPISDQKNIPHPFQTRPLGRNYVTITQIRGQTKNSSNPILIRIFLFLSYSFGIKTINTFIHSHSSLENQTRFRTKMGKVNTRFQTKTAQKPDPTGRHIPI